MVVLVFVAGFGNRQEVNYKLTIVNTINCNILFHSVDFFFVYFTGCIQTIRWRVLAAGFCC